MSVLQKMAYGAAESINRQAVATVNENMEMRRRERLAELDRKSNNAALQDKANFEDSRYDLESGRRHDELRKKLELQQEFAPPAKQKDWKTVELEIGKDSLNEGIKVPFRRDPSTGTLWSPEGLTYEEYVGPFGQFARKNLKKGHSIEASRAVWNARKKELNQIPPPKKPEVPPETPEKGVLDTVVEPTYDPKKDVAARKQALAAQREESKTKKATDAARAKLKQKIIYSAMAGTFSNKTDVGAALQELKVLRQTPEVMNDPELKALADSSYKKLIARAGNR